MAKGGTDSRAFFLYAAASLAVCSFAGIYGQSPAAKAAFFVTGLSGSFALIAGFLSLSQRIRD
jgi:hypothetical protein